MTEREKRLSLALRWWDKYAMYAMGANGHTPLTMPPFQAALFVRAVDASKAAVGDTFGRPYTADELATGADGKAYPDDDA